MHLSASLKAARGLRCGSSNCHFNLATSYDVYRNFAVYATGITGTQFINTAVTPGTTYNYSVLARNSSGSTGSATQSATAPNTCGSTDTATFVSETILDGTTVAAGQSFIKSWTIRNSGTTTWNSNYRLRWVSGVNLSNHSDVVIAGTVAPGSIYTFIVPMTAPTSGGTYREDWKLITGSGTTIPVSSSSTIWVRIKVADSSGTDKADFVAETHPDGTTVTAGQGFTKNWTVRNSGTTTWNSNYRLRWVSGVNLSSHADFAISGSVPPGSTYTFSVPMTAPNTTGTYREDWKLINGSGATLPIGGSSTIWVSVRVNVGGQSSITGSVTSSSGVPIAGANIQIGSNNTQSNSQGSYSISNIAAGDYTATVSKTGYATFSGPVSVPANTQINRNFALQSNTGATSISISSVTSKYPGKSFFLEGISHNVTFTANVDWGGHTPSSVSFITPTTTYVVPTSSNTAVKTINVGELGSCGRLRIKANATDGSVSPEHTANIAVMAQPPYLPPSLVRLVDTADSFKYELPSDVTIKIPIPTLSKTVGGFMIPGTIPYFGTKGMNVDFEASLDMLISADGSLRYGAKLGLGGARTNPDPFNFVKGFIGGQDFSLTSSFDASASFSESSCRWSNWSGVVVFNGDVFFNRKYPLPAFPIVAFDGGFGIKGEATLKLANLQPLTFDPSVSDVILHPYVRAHISASITFVGRVEGGFTGTLDWKIYPHHDLVGNITGEYKIVSEIFFFELEDKVFQCSYNLTTGAHGCDWLGFSPAVNLDSSSALTLYQRDYLGRSNYAIFQGDRLSKEIRTQELELRPGPTAVETNVFPLSAPNLSSSGNNLYLVWLYDDPTRTAINRSLVVFSSWNGTMWSAPKTIADDATADFHPQVLSFADGSGLATWEDSSAVMPDNATPDQLVRSVEISTSFFDAQSKEWTVTRRLTTNSYVDRSPLIAGQSSDDVLVVWISNNQNDLNGSSSKPNTLWSAKWNGTSWGTPQAIATIPYGIVKHDLTYRSGKGDVVLSLDTDNNQATDGDHELYGLHIENGTWGALTRLTNDVITDDNPRLAMDSKGNEVLVWMKGDEIYSAANGDVAGKRLVATPGHSTNAADFKLAYTPEGRIALTWAGINAQFDSDLKTLFYDPALDVWGGQSQLTSDPELESNIATAFYGDKLIAIYDRTTPTTTATIQSSSDAAQLPLIPTPGTTDLYMLSHVVSGDLAIKADTLAVSPTNPRSGELTTLTATIVNQGDMGARDVSVSFYQGNPAHGGILIGTTLVTTTLAPRGEQQVAIPWIPASTTSPFSIYVVVDPNQIFDDANRTNNVASKQVVRSDLAIQSTRWERQTDNSVMVIARVVNLGSLSTLPTTVSFRRDSSTGILLSSPSIGALDPDQSVDVAIQWDTTGLNSPQYTLYLLADPTNSVDEYDKTNNGATLVVSLNANAAPIQLILDQSSSASDQVAALDSVLFTSGPFPVTNPNSLNTTDRNTRVMIFISNLQLSPGEPSSSVVINLIDSNNQSYDIAAEDVRRVPNFDFTQVTFRLPNNLSVGSCTIRIKAHGQVSNAGGIRIRI